MKCIRLYSHEWGWMILALALVGASACGPGRIKTYPVSGSIELADGEPVAGADIFFHPVDGSKEFKEQRPWATTDAEGKFELKTFEKGDGAPAGKYRVTVKWRKGGKQSVEDDGRRSPNRGRDRFGRRFARPDTSGLEATVPSGGIELKPFQLKLP